MFALSRRSKMAFVPFAASAPRAFGPNASGAACSRMAPVHSAFHGASVSVPHLARVGAATIRMDVTVVVGDNEPIESALRRFKKDVTKSGHLFELRRRRYFETTTEKNIRKRAQSLRKARIARNMANKQRNNSNS